jgi:hypothetical protein
VRELFRWVAAAGTHSRLVLVLLDWCTEALLRPSLHRAPLDDVDLAIAEQHVLLALSEPAAKAQ